MSDFLGLASNHNPYYSLYLLSQIVSEQTFFIGDQLFSFPLFYQQEAESIREKKGVGENLNRPQIVSSTSR